ncbi:MAG: adenylate/guanylate cyclase domain-containing protein [Bacteroidales bacterium]|nr:adenylate/guanylate cyclase domain-containing protein [Bacteroidales bacterium]
MDAFPALTRIIIDYDSVLLSPDIKHLQTEGKVLAIGYRVKNLTFVVDSFEGYKLNYFLEGYDDKPSFHGEDYIKDYTNLPAGSYTLVLNYTTVEGNSGTGELISFRVLPPWYTSLVAMVGYPLLLLILLWYLYEQLNYRFALRRYTLEQIINTRTEELIREKEKSELLLANVLPKSTADEIMLKGKATKTKYNFVTVLFSDIQGFTRIAEEMNPEVLIDELDRFFFHFDSVVEKYNIEKIKTIGDAYMCAGGIPEKNRTNPVEVVLAAFEMQQYMAQLKKEAEKEGRNFWDIRIGIHTGTVVAGVVGHKKLSYDIWGDTVNTASRMESSGEAGKINISGTTYEFIRDFFICEHRGKMPVKYKGELDMYFVKGLQPGMSDDGVSPNSRFMVKLQTMKLYDVEEYVIKLFDDEAPPNFYFHSSSRIKNMSTQVDVLSGAEQLSDEDYIAVKLAVLFLYTGFLDDYDDPAVMSKNRADDILPRLGFDGNIVSLALDMIDKFFADNFDSEAMMVVHDAVYDYLGRVDYIKQTERLMKELRETVTIHNIEKWAGEQTEFLERHEFLTRTGRMLRSVPAEDQKKNLEQFFANHS